MVILLRVAVGCHGSSFLLTGKDWLKYVYPVKDV
jgi:hypothetical protein